MNAEAEYKALEIVLQKANKPRHATGKYIYKILTGSIEKSERPDFIIHTNKQKIGLEHFLISTVMRGEKFPVNIWEIQECKKLYNSYKGDMSVVTTDISNGILLKNVETIVNEYINIVNGFSYDSFINRFCNALSDTSNTKNHVQSINSYLQRCDELGFLVELPDITKGMYRVNGHLKSQKFVVMPFSYDMCDCIDSLFKNYKHLQFLIFVFSPNKVLYLYRDSWKKDLEIQKVHICKSFEVERKNKISLVLQK